MGQCCYHAFLFLLVSGFIASNSNAQTDWWGIGLTGCGNAVSDPEACPTCAGLGADNFFTASQELECIGEPSAIRALAKGAREAIFDCQERFNETRWNCSTITGQHLFGSFVANSHTRETGVLNAYFTAGAIWSIAEDCHSQRISSCPCRILNDLANPDSEGNTIFQVCSANVDYAKNFVKTFVESQIDSSLTGKIDLHNIEVGKELIKEIKQCRCHGISGTCSTQTCYNRTVTVGEIGSSLYTKYHGAVAVADEGGELVNTNTNGDAPTNKTLVYNTPSPDFCVNDTALGVPGVTDRKCDIDPSKLGSCTTLCCNNGFYTKTRIVPKEVCEFVFCCRIECKIVAEELIEEHFCNPPQS